MGAVMPDNPEITKLNATVSQKTIEHYKEHPGSKSPEFLAVSTEKRVAYKSRFTFVPPIAMFGAVSAFIFRKYWTSAIGLVLDCLEFLPL
jgi:hypothetical protein